MSDVLVLATARARGINLPADDDIAQAILDETEAELEQYLGGPLTGSRTETFYVGSVSAGKLSLGRYTDAATIEDNGTTVATDQYRLLDRGSAVGRDYSAASWWWTGPYVAVTYEPNDLLRVTSVLYQLLALSASPAQASGALKRERIGQYEYELGDTAAASAPAAAGNRRALARTLIPKRDALHNIRATRLDYPSREYIANAPEIPV